MVRKGWIRCEKVRKGAKRCEKVGIFGLESRETQSQRASAAAKAETDRKGAKEGRGNLERLEIREL
jgi:hypothetical protein